jgi:hypothetical protein
MPLFYFDIDEGSGSDHDSVGCEMPHEDVCTQAMQVLSEIASDIPTSTNQAFTAIVRDDTGKTILEAKLSLTARWLK